MIIGIAAAAVLLAAAVVWLVRFSPVLSVQQITVRGATTVPEAQLIAAAAVKVGTPLIAVDDQAVRDRVAALPQVATVEVNRAYPRELVLVVTERVPVAVVPVGARFRTVDVDGTEILDVADPRGLPVIRTTTPEGRAAALAVAASLPDRVRQMTDTVTATSRDSVDLRLRNGARVRWGDASRPERKATVLLALMRQKGALYDVSAPDLPVITG